MTTQLSASNIQAATLSALDGPTVTNIQVTDSSYTVLDDTAVSLTGGYIKITGANFSAGCTVTVGAASATAVTFVSSTTLHVQVPAAAAGTYVVYVVNSDGAVAIRVNGITYSSEPTWVTGSTLSGDSGTAVSIQLSATGASVYSLQDGSSLPANLTLTSGGLISGTVTIENETLYNFTVIATDAELQDSPRSFSITISVGDPYFNLTTLLLPGSADNFVKDASTNNLSLTVAGDTRPNSFNPYTPGYYSVFFDAKTDYVSVPAATSLTTFTGDFTFEAWIYPTDTTITYWLFWDSRQSGATAQAMVFGINPLASAVTGQGRLTYFNGTNYYGTGIVYYNRWSHVAFVRSGTTLTFYIDGVAGGTATVSGTQAGTATTNPIYISTKDNGLASYGTTGYISNLRVVNGTAVYTANFTPSAEPLTAVANTALLVCQSNRFIDNSSNAHTLTPSSVSISGFDPYLPVSSYSSYGSGYMDGTGDYVTVPTSNFLPATNTYTIEMWAYPTAWPSGTVMLYQVSNANAANFGALNVSLSGSGTIKFEVRPGTGGTNVALTASSTIALSAWSHIAVSVDSGSATVYLNGVASGTATVAAMNDTQTFSSIGYLSNGYTSGQSSFTDYMSDVRVVKGTALYTAAFTPPTAPLTAVSGTSLLTLQNNTPVTNNQFLDSSTSNLLLSRFGNATQGTFSPYSPAGWSNYFDGTGDNLATPVNAAFQFGTGDFTVECWVNFTSTTGRQDIVWWGASGTDRGGIIYNELAGNLTYYISPTVARAINYTWTPSIGVWYHIALARVSGSSKLYVNGVQVGSTYADSKNYSGSNFVNVGKDNNAASSYFFGYISNLRMIKGTGVYTNTFTPPTQPLTAIAGTSFLTCADNRFIDDSPNNIAITRVGDVRATNFSPFKAVVQTPVTYSAYFDGAGNTLSYTLPVAIGTQDFTYEAWVHRTSSSADENVFTNGSANNNGWNMAIDGQKLRARFDATNFLFSTSDIPVNQWTHCAITRQGSTVRIFVNGVLENTGTSAYNATATLMQVGSWSVGGATYDFTGYISNARIVIGTAVYTATFTPSTQPLTAVAGTSVLICQSPTIVDNSANRFAITVTGAVQSTTVNPFGFAFANSTGYTTTEYGGSMYFDGTGDYLSSPSNAAIGTGPFTIEFWMYPTALGTVRYIVDNGYWNIGNNGGYRIAILANNTIKLEAITNTYNSFPVTITSSTALPSANQWYHIAFVRNSGNSIMIYINGIPAATAVTYSSSLNLGSGQTFKVGGVVADNALQANPYVGYISNLRIISGTAIYPSSFVPPLAPVLPVSNTVALLNGTGAAITDATTKNNLETVGNAQLSSGTSKFGGTSMYFTGGGASYVQTPIDQPQFGFGTGDFTVELWINPVVGISYIFFDTRRQNESRINMGLSNNSAGMNVSVGSTAIISVTSGITPGAWNHVAVTRASGSLRLFINGTQAGSTTTMTTDLGALGSPCLATAGDARGNGAYGYTGYIQDVRVTRGFARYTANFTAPTAALKTK